MHKLYIFGLLALTAVVAAEAQAEEFTMSTYYPAPFGVYREMNVNYLDFKNDEYQEDFPSNLPDEEEGRLFYDMDTKEVKYHNGTNWQPLGGGACPAGFTDTGYGYCIQTNENSTLNWYDAADYCADNYGARLCSYSEWYNACVNNKANNMTGNYEWLDDMDTGDVSGPVRGLSVGEATCTALERPQAYYDTKAFRCCRSK